MSGYRKLAAIGVAAIAGAVVLAGCGSKSVEDKIAEKAIEHESGGDVDLNSKDASIKYTDKDGNQTELNTGGGASIPDGWPKALDPPKSVKIITSSTTKVDGKTAMTVLGEAEGTIEDLVPAIKQQVTDAGFEITQDSSTNVSGGGYAGLSASNDEADLGVAVAQDATDSGKVTITMTITEK